MLVPVFLLVFCPFPFVCLPGLLSDLGDGGVIDNRPKLCFGSLVCRCVVPLFSGLFSMGFCLFFSGFVSLFLLCILLCFWVPFSFLTPYFFGLIFAFLFRLGLASVAGFPCCWVPLLLTPSPFFLDLLPAFYKARDLQKTIISTYGIVAIVAEDMVTIWIGCTGIFLLNRLPLCETEGMKNTASKRCRLCV